MSEQNKALIRRWFEEVWNKGRPEAVDEMLSPEGVIRGLGAPQGPAEFKQFHRAYRNAFPDFTVQIDDVIGEGDMIAARWHGSGTHGGDGLGVPATGAKVQLAGMTFGRMQHGRIVEGWNIYDELGLLKQIGVVKLP